MRGYSKKLYEKSLGLMPGGVSNPIQAYQSYPSFMARGEGGLICDVDGNELVDLCLGFGPMVLGHGNPAVFDAVMRQANRGMAFGAPTVPELDLVEKLVKRVPCADMVRLVNSGTDAIMHTIRLARSYTGRDKVIKMYGGFHGALDSMLVKPGSAIKEHRTAGSPRVPTGAVENSILVEYNDLDAVSEALEEDDVAAIIVEPVMGNAGLIPPSDGYLKGLRSLTAKNGTLLIFDEVITGLRLAPGGAQEHYGVIPDMCTMGNAIGGGLPAGAVLGRKDVMSQMSPSGPVYVTGTLSGNPMTAAAGNAVMNQLSADVYRSLNRKGERMVGFLRDEIEDMGMTGCVNQVASMFQLFIGRDEVSNASEAHLCDADAFKKMASSMIESGVFIPPSQFQTCFLCTEHHDAHLSRVWEGFHQSLKKACLSGWD